MSQDPEQLDQPEEGRPAGPDRLRKGGEIVDVDFPQRTIELVVIPYDRETEVPYGTRRVRESVAPGSFDGIERRANRVRANRDHQNERPVGRAVSFHPSRDEGLVARVRISKTPLGDETLTLADDGVLSGSAGFRPMPGGELWTEHRTRVRITKAWLGHIAFTPDPQYDDAEVLAVRAAAVVASTTPNIDEYRSWRLQDLVASDQLYR